MRLIDEYEELLRGADMLGHGFELGELVRPRWRDVRGRYRLPPARLWANMLPTLRYAIILRSQWVAAGGSGLRIAAAYRPRGGSRRSRHKTNQALDLDLLRCDRALTDRYYEVAVRLWALAQPEGLRLGLYCPAGRRGGVRVHIDTGRGRPTWQIWRGQYIRPAVAWSIAHDIGAET